MNRALFERNALACETAKHPVCTCPCGGQFHGVKHSKAWLDATWSDIEAAIEADRAERNKSPTRDLFEDAP
jgi:hypothetical protein